MDSVCSICRKKIDSDTSAILAMGGFGTPRYMCCECEEDFNEMMFAKDSETISLAMERVGRKMIKSDSSDKVVFNTVEEIMNEARGRREKIEAGTYDFSEDDTLSAESLDSVPEELLESDEDLEDERRRAEKNAKLEKITNWVCFAVLLGVIVFLIYRVVSMYF